MTHIIVTYPKDLILIKVRGVLVDEHRSVWILCHLLADVGSNVSVLLNTYQTKHHNFKAAADLWILGQKAHEDDKHVQEPWRWKDAELNTQ